MDVKANIRVGVIGQRVIDPVAKQGDMAIARICKIGTDWRMRVVARRGFLLYAATGEQAGAMRQARLAAEPNTRGT